MAKLKFEQEFELEVGDKSYTGVLKDLTKKEKEEFEKVNKLKKDQTKELQKLIKQAKKLQRKIEIAEKQEKWDIVEKLELELDEVEAKAEKVSEKLDDPTVIEDMFKERIKKSVSSENLADILALGELYSYQQVFKTIVESVQEKQEGK